MKVHQSMTPFEDFKARLMQIIHAIFKDQLDDCIRLDSIVVEAPKQAAHGHLATNAAMILAKPLKSSPRIIAQSLADRLLTDKDVAKLDIAGPGFINLSLKDSYWFGVLKCIDQDFESFSRPNLGQGAKINIEYVSANPTGPLHVGHVRGAVFGDALASLMAATGFKVTREYYINDAGGQIDILSRSALLRYRQACGEDIGDIPEGFYPGDYLVPVGEALKRHYGDVLLQKSEKQAADEIRSFVLDSMMDLIRQDLALLNIEHDFFFSEQTLHGQGKAIDDTLKWLTDEGLVYQGRLDPPKGTLPDDWEDREQTLFRATQFGDDIDRALVKSDGTYTYFAADIAYHRDKFLRGFKHQVDVLGADHGGYIKRLQAAVMAVSQLKANVEVKICQLVHLMRDGVPVKMSKRSGNLVTARDVVEEVGADVVRFMMLYRRNDVPLDFDFSKVIQESRENPVYYVQYAHARCAGIFRRAQDELPQGLDLNSSAKDLDVDGLGAEAEIDLIKALASYTEVLMQASRDHEPHKIAFYLYHLANLFAIYYNKGTDLPDLRIIRPEDECLSRQRLVLTRLVKRVLEDGLGILGVSAPEELT